MKTKTSQVHPVEPEKPQVAPVTRCAGQEAQLEEFILRRRIDSFHKIWLLLFLHQHSQEDRINRDYVRLVTFTDAPALDEVIEELQDAGLLIANGETLSLKDDPGVRSDLDAMADVYEDPAGRQELLRRLYRYDVNGLLTQRIRVVNA